MTERLRTAAQGPAVYAHFPVRAEESLDLAVAISRAVVRARRARLRRRNAEWVRRDPSAPDGVPTSAVPAVQDDEPRHTDIPLRDSSSESPAPSSSTPARTNAHIAVIFTEADSASERVRAGQSMMRLMIQAELDDLASCPMSQSVDDLLPKPTAKPDVLERIPADDAAPRASARYTSTGTDPPASYQ